MSIIDADAHVLEGAGFAKEALARWPDEVRYQVDAAGRGAFTIEGRRYPEAEGPGAGCPPEHGVSTADGIDPHTVAGMLRDADRETIDQMVLYPSLGMGVPGFRDGAFAAAFAQLYNEYVADWCKQAAGRLHFVAVVPIEDVDRSVDILTAARRGGCVGVMLPPALRDRNLDHPDLDPFYAAAADLDVPIGVHGAPGVHLPQIGVDRFRNYVQVHCISFPFDQMTALTAMASGGVFERHPGLRVAFLEAGATWLPFFLDRLHEHFEKRGDWIESGWKRSPREYVARGQVYVTCEPEESLLAATIGAVGPDVVMYASDYPHWDSEFPESTRPLRTRTDLDDGARAQLLAGNAARFYGLESRRRARGDIR